MFSHGLSSEVVTSHLLAITCTAKSILHEFLHIFLGIFLRETQNMQLWSQNSCIYSIAFDTAKFFQKFSVVSTPAQLAMLGSKELAHEQDSIQDSLSGVFSLPHDSILTPACCVLVQTH